MKSSVSLRVIVVEASMIVRSGVINLLKRIPGQNIHPVEVVSVEALHECMRMQQVDIVIINPTFGGWFDIESFRENTVSHGVKWIALLCSVVDSALLKGYDDTMSIYETAEMMGDKLNRLQHISVEEEQQNESETLSQREKEIIVCVVKGMTNKAIADKLYLSIHTVITHRRNIARKLQIHSPAGLTIYAIVNKLVELQDIEDAVV